MPKRQYFMDVVKEDVCIYWLNDFIDEGMFESYDESWE